MNQYIKYFIRLTFISSFIPLGAQEMEMASRPIDFIKDIQPILQEKCYKCHGPKKVKGGLRLDSPAVILQGGDGGEVVIAGNADDSSFYYLTTFPTDDPDYMPSKGKGLSQTQQELFKNWIDQGTFFGKEQPQIATKPKSSKYENREYSGTYRIATPLIPVIAALREQGLLVDTANHNASKFEITYTYAKNKDYSFDELTPLLDSVIKINVSRTSISNADLSKLAKLTELQSLNLSNTDIDDSGLLALTDLKKLTYLNLNGTKVTDSGINLLSKIENLEKLYIWNTFATAATAKKLEDKSPHLEVIF